MPEAIALGDRRVLLSISRLSEEFGMARETVAKRLAAAFVTPAGKRNGHPVYGMRQAAEALLDSATLGDDGQPDPKRMAPNDRNAWYQSEIRRLDFEQQCGALVPAAEVLSEMSQIVKAVNESLGTLPDVLERDKKISPDQVEYVIKVVDRLKRDLVSRVADADSDDVRVSD